MNYVCLMDGNEYLVRTIDGKIKESFLLNDCGVIRKKVTPTSDMMFSFYQQIEDGLALNEKDRDKRVVDKWARDFFNSVSARYKYLTIADEGERVVVSKDRPKFNEEQECVIFEGMNITDLVPLDVLVSMTESRIIERKENEV